MSYYDNASTPMFDSFSRPAEHHVTCASIWAHRDEILNFFPEGARIDTPIGTLTITPPVRIAPYGTIQARSEQGWSLPDVIHSMRTNPNECSVTGIHSPPEDREAR